MWRHDAMLMLQPFMRASFARASRGDARRTVRRAGELLGEKFKLYHSDIWHRQRAREDGSRRCLARQCRTRDYNEQK